MYKITNDEWHILKVSLEMSKETFLFLKKQKRIDKKSDVEKDINILLKKINNELHYSKNK